MLVLTDLLFVLLVYFTNVYKCNKYKAVSYSVKLLFATVYTGGAGLIVPKSINGYDWRMGHSEGLSGVGRERAFELGRWT